MGESGVNKAQELISWFENNGDSTTDMWDIDVDWFNPHEYMDDTYDLVGESRWSIYKTAVWQFDDGSFAEINWEEGATEQQETDANISIIEVEPYEETVIKYRRVK